jgi:maleylpyruvate isomerase
MILHGYFRSSAAYRVRIALNLKGLVADQVSHHLRKGEQRTPDYLELNPQGLVPALILDDGAVLTQSLAIIEYLDELHPNPPLLPKDPLQRAKVRAFALAISCDLHPVQNLKVLKALKDGGFSEEQVNGWARDVNAEGLAACERLLAQETEGPFCFGATPTLADICLVPQMGNARRFGADIKGFTKLLAAEAAAQKLPAFQAAAPDKQPDAE